MWRLEAFDEMVLRTFQPEAPTGFWDLCEPFRALLASDFLVGLLNEELNREHPLRIDAFSEAHGRIRFTNQVRMDLLLLDEDWTPPPDLRSDPHHAMAGLVGSDSRIDIRCYSPLEAHANDEFEKGARLGEPRSLRLVSGDCVRFYAGVDVVRWSPPTHPVVLVLLRSPPILEFVWRYDPTTRLPTELVSHDVTAYRLFFAAHFLGQLESPDGIEGLEAISHHRSHFVRWAAMQNLFECNFEAALERLRIALEDRHPAIRTAARQALDELGDLG